MTVRVEVSPAMLQWARARSGIDDDVWVKRFPRYDTWVAGESNPTLRQLEEFARKTYTPVGFFFLDEPPTENIPVPDFRTIGDRPVAGGVTANLLDTLYICLARQEWYRDSQLLNGESPLEFVGTATLRTEPAQAAAAMREQLAWTSRLRASFISWDAALTTLRENAEAAGVLVMISGVVGSNTQRKLAPEEFRGFALADPFAALVFVNGADAKTAQVFTLAHELAHLWLGSTALSDVDPMSARNFEEERWCNQVAAELLVPMDEFESTFDRAGDLRSQLRPLAERFRVSTQVILGRIREMGALSWDQFMTELRIERERVVAIVTERAGGGNYYTTKPVQVGKRFARELIASTLEGRTTYTEAFRLLGVKKTSTFEGLGQQLGVL
ncbi:MAG: ImmA/IrrE family metallo-endopeptidase [Acidimicrobiaceae bacterium]|nr:ImmA/IrrE family metallo-endopeptidase [Acidimicrobiaceae bacterium]